MIKIFSYFLVLSFALSGFAFATCEKAGPNKLCCTQATFAPSNCSQDGNKSCTLGDKVIGVLLSCPIPNYSPVKRALKRVDHLRRILTADQTDQTDQCAEITNRVPALDQRGSQSRANSVDLTNVDDIRRVLSHVQELIQTGMDPEEILVEFDIDGVLTNYSEPKVLQNQKEIRLRTHALDVVNELRELGVDLIASSAHGDFRGTLDKLRHIGLDEQFKVSGCKIETGIYQTHQGEDLEYSRCGSVVSVKSPKDRGYKRKAFSPIVGRGDNLKKVKRVVYVDDRLDFILQFKKDKASALRDKNVDYFNLTWLGPRLDSPIRARVEPQALKRDGCEGLCPQSDNPNDFIHVSTSPNQQEEFQTFMTSPSAPSSKDVIEKMITLQPQLYELFKSTNRGKEKDTIESHSSSVMDTFESQFQHYNLSSIHIPGVRNLQSLLRAGLALHDIGKPLGGTKKQHENTAPILEDVLKQLGYNPDEVKLASILFNSDVGEIGRPIDGHTKTAREAAQEIIKQANDLRMPPLSLLQMQTAFFASDASYYPALRKGFRYKTESDYKNEFDQTSKIEPLNPEINKIGTEIKLVELIDDVRNFYPPLTLTRKERLSMQSSPERILRFFPKQKLEMEETFMKPEHRSDRSTLTRVKEAALINSDTKVKIIQTLMDPMVSQGREQSTIQELMQAIPGSGRAVAEEVLTSIDFLYKQAKNKRAILKDIEIEQRNSNEKIRTLATALLNHFGQTPGVPDPFTNEERQQWTFTDPESLRKDENLVDPGILIDPKNPIDPKDLKVYQLGDKNFTFLIHGVLPNSLRPNGSSFGCFFGETPFQNPSQFLGRKRICTSLIGKEEVITHEKKEDTQIVNTFSPIGFILNVPRDNVIHASASNFASNGRYVSKKRNLPDPKSEILVKTPQPDGYNEILVEGTNRLSGKKSEIAGVFVKEGTKPEYAQEAIEFAASRGLPIMIIPGKWKEPKSFQQHQKPPVAPQKAVPPQRAPDSPNSEPKPARL
jgi:hypothetical protein